MSYGKLAVLKTYGEKPHKYRKETKRKI